MRRARSLAKGAFTRRLLAAPQHLNINLELNLPNLLRNYSTARPSQLMNMEAPSEQNVDKETENVDETKIESVRQDL